jgi:hypothetical protein
LPDQLDVLPLELALKSASPSEVVLPFRDANQALDTFARLGWRVLGWEGWIRTPDGAVGHGDAPHGTPDLSELTKEQAVALCRRTMHTAHAEWRGSDAYQGAELLFASLWQRPDGALKLTYDLRMALASGERST